MFKLDIPYSFCAGTKIIATASYTGFGIPIVKGIPDCKIPDTRSKKYTQIRNPEELRLGYHLLINKMISLHK